MQKKAPFLAYKLWAEETVKFLSPHEPLSKDPHTPLMRTPCGSHGRSPPPST